MHGGVAMRLNSALLVLAVATGASAALPTRTPLATLPVAPGKLVTRVETTRVDFAPGQTMPEHKHLVPVVCFVAKGAFAVSIGDDPVVAGRVDDSDRIMYLRNYLTEMHRAVAEGYPLKGYFLWSLMDNFEWADGYTNRFGIHYVDYATQKRTPKLSAAWYKELIARNRVV